MCFPWGDKSQKCLLYEKVPFFWKGGEGKMKEKQDKKL